MASIAWGYSTTDVDRIAWRAARQCFERVLPVHERADIGKWAITVAILDADERPEVLDLIAAADQEITDVSRARLRFAGYSTDSRKRGEFHRGYAPYWLGHRGQHQDFTEALIERLALAQILPVVNYAFVLQALADFGTYDEAARQLGYTRGSFTVALNQARREFRYWWSLPDPPAPMWGRDRRGPRAQSDADLASSRRYERRHRNRKARAS